MTMYTTVHRAVEDGFIRAAFGVNSQRYFSLTGECSKNPTFSDRSIYSCGTLHKEVSAAFPELAHLTKWHLATDGVPMHYIPNARYWYDLATGKTQLDVILRLTSPEIFAKHCIELPWENLQALLTLEWHQVETYLELRVPTLFEAYTVEVTRGLPDLATSLCYSQERPAP